MDLKELKKLIEQVQAEKKQTIKEANTTGPFEYGDDAVQPARTTIHQDAVDILKYFATQYPTKPLTGLAYYRAHMEEILNFAKQYEASQGISTDTPQQELQAIRKMSNAKVQDYIRKLLAKMGLADEIINAVDKELDLAIDKAEKAEKDVLSQMPPKQSVSPTNQTVVRPSSIPSTNSTNPGSPLAQARQRARKGSSTKP